MNTDNHILAFLQSLGWPELLVIGIIALLIFGKRLPEVGRSLGRSFVEFKKGLKDTGDELRHIQSDVDQTISNQSPTAGEQTKSFNEPSAKAADLNQPK